MSSIFSFLIVAESLKWGNWWCSGTPINTRVGIQLAGALANTGQWVGSVVARSCSQFPSGWVCGEWQLGIPSENPWLKINSSPLSPAPEAAQIQCKNLPLKPLGRQSSRTTSAPELSNGSNEASVDIVLWSSCSLRPSLLSSLLIGLSPGTVANQLLSC